MRFRAFTLVEMMVALAVTGLLSVLMLRMFMDSSAIWKANDERLETFREARAALQLMAREIGAVNPQPLNSDSTSGSKDREQFPLLALRHHPETEPEDQVNQEVYMLTSTRNRGKGDLCAVGYFCRWDNARKTFALRRIITGSDTTFANLQRCLGTGSQLSPGNAFSTLYARSRAAGATPEAPANDEQSQDEELATYVWDLQFAIPDPVDPLLAGPEWPQGTFCNELPQWLEIRFKALGASAARKIEGQPVTRETWFDDQSSLQQRLISPYEQQFVTRVKLAR